MHIEKAEDLGLGKSEGVQTVPGLSVVSSGSSMTNFMPRAHSAVRMGPRQTKALVEPLAKPRRRDRRHHGELRANIHAGHEAVGRRAEFVHALVGEAEAATPRYCAFATPQKMGALTGVPARSARIRWPSVRANHWLNWPMERIKPPRLWRNAGAQGSSKAKSLIQRSFPRPRKKSPRRKSAERRLAPVGSSR